MGLIIKRNIQKLMAGFPTVSDKYNVQGGIVSPDSDPVLPGFALFSVFGNAPGEYFANIKGDAASLAGIALATNVKTPRNYPAGAGYYAPFMPGEAVNCMIEGYVAVVTDMDVQLFTEGSLTDGLPVYVNEDGAFAPDDSSSGYLIPGARFTGIAEIKAIQNPATGESHNVVVAEIYLPMPNTLLND